MKTKSLLCNAVRRNAPSKRALAIPGFVNVYIENDLGGSH